VEECNKALRKLDRKEVSKRTIQNDINALEADYGILLDEKLKRGRQRLYRYVDTDYSLPLIRISNNRFNYIKTKPLHLSQHVISEDNGHTTISINVKINKELIALILSFGSDIEVLSPASLRAEIIKKIHAMSYNYPNDEKNRHT
jgi:predicted DNA-binding transcriptional regulator YafY